MDCPHPIMSVLPRFYPTWSSRTRPSMRIQRSEGLGSRLPRALLAYYEAPSMHALGVSMEPFTMASFQASQPKYGHSVRLKLCLV